MLGSATVVNSLEDVQISDENEIKNNFIHYRDFEVVLRIHNHIQNYDFMQEIINYLESHVLSWIIKLKLNVEFYQKSLKFLDESNIIWKSIVITLNY